MGNAIFDINGELKDSKDLLYEDIIILGKQFVEKNNRYPMQIDFRNSNNLPSDQKLQRLLDSMGKTKYNFYKDIGCDDIKILSKFLNQDQINNFLFPIFLQDGIILYYDRCENSDEKNEYEIYCHDQFGYKYRIKKRVLYKHIKTKTPLHRFSFVNRYFLKDNINNYLKLNNCVYKVNNIPEETTDRDNLEFVSIYEDDVVYMPISSLLSNPNRLTEKGKDIRLKRRKTKDITKDQVIRKLKEKQEELGRPLFQRDLESNDIDNYISRNIINKYWGSFSKMIEELNLMSHNNLHAREWISEDKCREIVSMVCDKVNKEKRKLLLVKDFSEDETGISYRSLLTNLKDKGLDLRRLVMEAGVEIAQNGEGINYYFDDGEFCRSSYEYDFSNILRENGFIYNKTYFRDVKYSDIDKVYTGKMNCDYMILYNNETYYIELAGMLYNKGSIEAYYNNTPVLDEKTEKYRQKMLVKKRFNGKER